jgi:hypothetical protein
MSETPLSKEAVGARCISRTRTFSPPVSSRLPHRGDTNHDHEYDGDDVGDYVCREPCVRHFSSLRRQKDQTEIRAYNEE